MLPRYPHQDAAIARALAHHGSLALFHEPGLGKTRTCLDLYATLRTDTPTLKLLVICPLSLIEAAWGADTEKFTSFRWCALKRYDRTADIFVINYEAIIRTSGQRLLQESGLLAFPLMLVVDESSRLRDSKSLTTKTILALAERCQYRFVLSGTPAPNGLHELWAQLKVVNPDSVHRSFYAWRREYFHLGRNGRTMSEPPPSRGAMASLFQQGWSWQITQANRDRLLARAVPIAHWVRKEDALQLPERITQIRHVTLSPNEQRAYTLMKQQLVVEFEQEVVTAEIALTKLMKLRQLSSGFLYGETTHTLGTSRLNVLKETLDELGEQPVIIWANFHEEIEQISKLLGEKAVTLYAKTPDRNESLRRFGTDAQYLIAHPRSAGHGLTLTQASTCVWYSLDWSLEAYSQANDRIHRIGQTRSCLYVHLIAPGLIDEHIWDVLQKKATLQEAIDRILGNRSLGHRSELAATHRTGDQVLVPNGVGLSPLGEVEVRHP